MADPKGEGLKLGFDGSLRLEFHGAKVTSDAGLLAYRDLDEALGLFDSVPFVFHDSRTGRNIQHHLTALLRQSVYSRLAGYEDVNDAHRLSVDPTMRRITGKNINNKSFVKLRGSQCDQRQLVHETQLQRPPISARNYQSCRVAVPSVHAELSRCRGSAG